MYAALMPLLADRYHLIAPDYPGFGHSGAPDPQAFAYTFDRLAEIMDALMGALNMRRYVLRGFSRPEISARCSATAAYSSVVSAHLAESRPMRGARLSALALVIASTRACLMPVISFGPSNTSPV
jgi:pimeloyl-ACP methyl ester carboxylesterase